jgi:3D (Asp-Asp-Asp) domain-containing protein
MRDHKFNIAAVIIIITVAMSPYLGEMVTPEPEPEAEPHAGIHFPGSQIEQPFQAAIASIPEKPILKPKAVMEFEDTIFPALDTVTIPTTEMKLTSLGTYYVTGYTSSECGGSTTTASGATCHKASWENRLTEPTTCAIDPKIHDFGDLFYIPAFDTVYVAEDTGSAVKGKHLDLYYLDSEYSQVLQITGYYEVYSVEYEYGTAKASDYDVRKISQQEMLQLLTEEEQ